MGIMILTVVNESALSDKYPNGLSVGFIDATSGVKYFAEYPRYAPLS